MWPLFFDVTNPTPDTGLHGGQPGLDKRLKTIGIDCILALALIHHLCITNNFPFEFIARYFAGIAPYLIIEFVNRSDSWATELLDRKLDAREQFGHYDQGEFEKAFKSWYTIVNQEKINGTHRELYLMKRKGD